MPAQRHTRIPTIREQLAAHEKILQDSHIPKEIQGAYKTGILAGMVAYKEIMDAIGDSTLPEEQIMAILQKRHEELYEVYGKMVDGMTDIILKFKTGGN